MSSSVGHALIGGGTGFVGTQLCKHLRNKGYNITVISRLPGPNRMTWHEVSKNGLPETVTAVVNLAGQNILDMSQRWNEGFKQNVWNSRVHTTQTIAQAISKAKIPPKCFVTVSGVGYYPPSSKVEYTEESCGGNADFLSKLAAAWEEAAKLPEGSPCRLVTIRSGVVLGRQGGMIKQIFLPFFFGVGGPIGDGNQYLPWIHINDMIRLITYSIENENVRGILNGVAPQQITNKEFTKAFASALWRPAIIPLPAQILNLLLNEERAKIMTSGQRVIPKRTLETGFKFNYADIDSACKEFARLRE